MARKALSGFGEHIISFKLTPGPHGKFDVIVDGQLVAEYRHEPNAHVFPDLQKAINARIGGFPAPVGVVVSGGTGAVPALRFSRAGGNLSTGML